MSAVCVAVALGAALLLGAGGLVHLRDRRRLSAALDQQDVLPRWTRAVLAYTLGPVETVVATAAVVAWLAGSVVVLACVGILYLAFGVYTLVLRVRAPGAPCGCFGAAGRVTWAVVARAWVLAAVVAASQRVEPDPALGPRLVLLVPAVLVALAAWLLGEVTQPSRRHPALY